VTLFIPLFIPFSKLELFSESNGPQKQKEKNDSARGPVGRKNLRNRT
jgi:hypothetical protein